MPKDTEPKPDDKNGQKCICRCVVHNDPPFFFLEYFLLAGLAAVCIAAVYYAVRKVQWRQRLIPIVVFLVLFFVICCCGVAVRADTIGSVPMVEASAGLLNPGWLRIALDLVLVVLMLLPVGG